MIRRHLVRRSASLLVAVLMVATGSITGWPLGMATGKAHAAELIPLPTPGTCEFDPATPKHDLRAMWIATVVNVDWPSEPGLSAAEQQAELISWLDLAVARNFNAVILQVRPTADAFWPSDYEPWSRYLSGTQGVDPGYDPLAFAVDQAHRRNLAVHAWFNPYRVAMDTNWSDLAPTHPARRNPQWVVKHEGRLYYDPGIPEVRTFVIDAMMDAVARYDIDAVHFDDYFYPYGARGKRFNDADTYRTYGAGAPLAEWRRANVNALITEFGARIKAIKPWVQLGISPFAVWRNAATDPSGSATRAGVQTYDDLYADTRTWVRDGWIDYIAPQIYWTRDHPLANYKTLVQWWAREIDAARANGHQVGLYIGEAAYRAGTRDGSWRRPRELSRHLGYASRFEQVAGHIYFSAKDVRADRKRAISRLVQRWYTRPALQPVIGRTSGAAPAPVPQVTVRGGTVTWTSPGEQAAGYAVYRIPREDPQPCDLADARHLVVTLPGRDTQLTWQDPNPSTAVTYVVTAVDRNGRESAGAIGRS